MKLDFLNSKFYMEMCELTETFNFDT